jgi:hypothetical protein
VSVPMAAGGGAGGSVSSSPEQAATITTMKTSGSNRCRTALMLRMCCNGDVPGRLLTLAAALAVALSALLTAGCGGDEAKSAAPPAEPAKAVCPASWKPGWQELANRIQAPVYCPSWMPDPLTGELDGDWNNIYSVDDDGSYLAGFTWYEVQSGEVHVNLRGQRENTEIPVCEDVRTTAGKTTRKKVPCFDDSQGTKQVGPYEVMVYTRNRGADQWHVLYAWERDGSLYALSEHVAEPLTYAQVVRNLDRMLRGLVLIEPQAA